MPRGLGEGKDRADVREVADEHTAARGAVVDRSEPTGNPAAVLLWCTGRSELDD
jgi:hypothetical protein